MFRVRVSWAGRVGGWFGEAVVVSASDDTLSADSPDPALHLDASPPPRLRWESGPAPAHAGAGSDSSHSRDGGVSLPVADQVLTRYSKMAVFEAPGNTVPNCCRAPIDRSLATAKSRPSATGS